MNHKYIYSARAREVAAKQGILAAVSNKVLFLLAMLTIAFFAVESEASWNSNDFHRAGMERNLLASEVYIVSHYAQKFYRKPYGYRHHYRPGKHYYNPRYRGRYYNRHHYKRHYNQHSNGKSYQYRRYY